MPSSTTDSLSIKIASRYLIIVFFWLGSGLATAQNDPSARAEFDRIEKYFNYGRSVGDRYEKGRYLGYTINAYQDFLRAFPRSSDAAEANYHLGYSLQTLGRVDEAITVYKNTISKFGNGDPVGSSARQLAYLAEANKDYANAAKYFHTAVRHLKKNELRQAAMAKEAHNLVLANKNEDAISALQRILDDPNNPHQEWARFSLGYQYHLAGKHLLAIEKFAPLLEAGSISKYRGRAMFYSGLSNAELGNEDSATEFLENMLAMPSDSTMGREEQLSLANAKALAQTALMGLLFKKEDYEGVIKLYHKGDYAATGLTEARRNMSAGLAYFKLKRYSNARVAFSRADRALPNSSTAFDASYYTLECDYQLNDPGLPARVDTFLELYGGSKSDSPSLQMARFLKAETLYSLDRYTDASKTFAKIDPTKIDPHYRPQILFKQGWSAALTNDHNNAIRLFSKYLSDYPEDPQRLIALSKRGESYLQLGDRVSARKDFEAILAQKPDGEMRTFALQKSAVIMRQEKDYASMIQNYTELLKEASLLRAASTANAEYWIGWGYYKTNQYDLALPHLEKAITLDSENFLDPATTLTVLIAHAQKQPLAMRDAINRLQDSYPNKYIPDNLLTWLGFQLYHSGNFKDAARFLKMVANPKEAGPQDLELWRILAKADNEIGEFESALQATKIVLKLEKEPLWRADAQLDLAQALLGVNKLDQAREAAQKGLDYNIAGTHLAGLHLTLGQIDLLEKRYPEASAQFDDTIKLLVNDPVLKPKALHLAALAAEAQNRTALAEQYRTQIKNDFPTWKPE